MKIVDSCQDTVKDEETGNKFPSCQAFLNSLKVGDLALYSTRGADRENEHIYLKVSPTQVYNLKYKNIYLISAFHASNFANDTWFRLPDAVLVKNKPTKP